MRKYLKNMIMVCCQAGLVVWGPSATHAQGVTDSAIPRAHALSGLDDGLESQPFPMQKPPQEKDDSVLDQGTETRPTPELLASLGPWIHNTKIALEDLSFETQGMPLGKAKSYLIDGINQIVKSSVPKRTELFVRYILNRARKTVEAIDSAGGSGNAGVLSQEVRFLELSVKLAQVYYQSDVDYLRQIASDDSSGGLVQLNFGEFGIRYARFLMTFDRSILSVSARYNVAINALGYLMWDLDKDANRTSYGPAIGHLDNFLNTMPEYAGKDDVVSAENIPLVGDIFDRVKTLLSEANLPVDEGVNDFQ